MKKLSDIDKNKTFTGYYWLSDSDKPKILNEEKFGFNENENNFIQEAYFKDDENSYSIKHFGGKGYIVSIVNINEIIEKTEYTYIADPAIVREADKKGIEITKLKFITEWKAEVDDLCKEMEVLKPGRVAFTGFEYKKGDEK